MKRLVFGLVAVLALNSSALAQGDHHVRGYTRADGAYVAPHYQTNPNSTTRDNYSTVGNVNPYTGVPGTKPDIRPGYAPAPTHVAPTYAPYRSAPKPGCTAIYC